MTHLWCFSNMMHAERVLVASIDFHHIDVWQHLLACNPTVLGVLLEITEQFNCIWFISNTRWQSFRPTVLNVVELKEIMTPCRRSGSGRQCDTIKRCCRSVTAWEPFAALWGKVGHDFGIPKPGICHNMLLFSSHMEWFIPPHFLCLTWVRRKGRGREGGGKKRDGSPAGSRVYLKFPMESYVQ